MSDMTVKKIAQTLLSVAQRVWKNSNSLNTDKSVCATLAKMAVTVGVLSLFAVTAGTATYSV